MKNCLPVLALVSLLAACSGEPSATATQAPEKPEQAAQKASEAQPAPAPVRAPEPPPPPGGGKKAPEIPPEQLEKLRAELEAKMKEVKKLPAK
jgi:hypothetical protein